MAAKPIREYTDPETGAVLVEYDSGLVRDKERSRIVKPAPGSLITEQNTSELYRRRRELKRATVREVASQAAQAEKYAIHGDMAYIAAITEQITVKALNPKDPKQVDAARFLLREAGDSEEQLQEDNVNNDAGLRGVLSDLAKIADAAVQLYAKKSD